MADPTPPVLARQLTTAEREATVARLSSAFADDVIPMEEFERRTTAAFRASSPAELAALLADLPAPASSATIAAGRADGMTTLVPAPQSIRAVFGNVERGGMQEMPGLLEIRAIFGNVELDLSTAHFTASITEISIRAVCGNVELWLPMGAIVENLGTSVLGGFTCRAPAGRDGTPGV